MKKSNNTLIALVLFLGLLFQPLWGSESLFARATSMFIADIIRTIRKTTITRLSGAVVSYLASNFGNMISINGQNEARIKEEYNNLKQIYSTEHLIKSPLSTSITDRIDEIINLKLQGPKLASDISVFPTIKSKIFVLKNIQDFFDLGDQNLNRFVYEESVKKINELEKKLNRSVDEEGNVVFYDKDEHSNAIDDTRNLYMQRYDISVQALKRLSSLNKQQLIRELDTKIGNINGEIDKITNDIIQKKRKEIKEQVKVSVEEEKTKQIGLAFGGSPIEKEAIQVSKKDDVKFRALLSILAHLMYMKSQKSNIFGKREAESKKAELGKEIQAKQMWKQELADKEVSVSAEITPEVAKEKKEALTKQYATMKFLSKEEGIQKAKEARTKRGVLAPEFTEEEFPQNIPSYAQQARPVTSWWSRIKSYWGW